MVSTLKNKSVDKACVPGLCRSCLALLLAALFFSSAISAQTETVAENTGLMAMLGLEPFNPDQSQWSDKARANYTARKDIGGEPLAVLTIERLNVTAPVYKGTKSLTLDRGVGLVESNPSPGEAGNIAISGHRDSFFRPLQDIKLDDKIIIDMLDGSQRFRVSDVKIVDALDTSVLEDRGETVLTLITCHPFYFVGFAPDRYIVTAIPVDEEPAGTETNSTRPAAVAETDGNTGGVNANE